jgi:hypothetical protein
MKYLRIGTHNEISLMVQGVNEIEGRRLSPPGPPGGTRNPSGLSRVNVYLFITISVAQYPGNPPTKGQQVPKSTGSRAGGFRPGVGGSGQTDTCVASSHPSYT